MPIRACTECGKPFKAPPHQPGKPAVVTCDRHAVKAKPAPKPKPPATDPAPTE